jgi:hypothetical protein
MVRRKVRSGYRAGSVSARGLPVIEHVRAGCRVVGAGWLENGRVARELAGKGEGCWGGWIGLTPFLELLECCLACLSTYHVR